MVMKRGGLAKLTEECGEVVQVCGKADQVDGLDNPHWSGDLRKMLEDEIGDVCAAINFVINKHGLDCKRINDRAQAKWELFHKWDKE